MLDRSFSFSRSEVFSWHSHYKYTAHERDTNEYVYLLFIYRNVYGTAVEVTACCTIEVVKLYVF